MAGAPLDTFSTCVRRITSGLRLPSILLLLLFGIGVLVGSFAFAFWALP